MRTRTWKALFLAAILLTLSAVQASALVFNFNQAIGGGPPISTIPSYGTLTITDSATPGAVDLLLDLNVDSYKILEFSLNYGGAAFGPGTVFSLSTGDSVTLAQDAIKADGYKGRLDIGIQSPSGGNINALGSYSAILSANDRTLTALDFEELDTLSLIYAGLHVGSLPNGDSIWLGATSTPVPEPGTMILFGAGIFGLAIYGKRRRNG